MHISGKNTNPWRLGEGARQVLKINQINSFYGQVQALHDVSFEVGPHEIISIIGANGAGKSTLMKSVMGIIRAQSGEITFQNTAISRMKTHQIVKAGIVYVPEGREVFPELSVQDNLEMGAYSRNYSFRELHVRYDQMYEIFPRLRERRTQLAGSLSGGEQQMLAIARAMMSDPKLIMFDEPSLGLAPIIVDEVLDIIQRISAERDMPVVLVEQNAFAALSISNRCYVMENGRIVKTGKSSDLLDSPDIKKAYLGG